MNLDELMYLVNELTQEGWHLFEEDVEWLRGQGDYDAAYAEWYLENGELPQ